MPIVLRVLKDFPAGYPHFLDQVVLYPERSSQRVAFFHFPMGGQSEDLVGFVVANADRLSCRQADCSWCPLRATCPSPARQLQVLKEPGPPEPIILDVQETFPGGFPAKGDVVLIREDQRAPVVFMRYTDDPAIEDHLRRNIDRMRCISCECHHCPLQEVCPAARHRVLQLVE